MGLRFKRRLTEGLPRKKLPKGVINVSDDAPPAIKGQALAFRDQVKAVVTFYLREAVKSDRTTVFNELNNAGQPQLAELIRRL